MYMCRKGYMFDVRQRKQNGAEAPVSTSLAEDKHYESYFNWNPYVCFKIRVFALNNVAKLAW